MFNNINKYMLGSLAEYLNCEQTQYQVQLFEPQKSLQVSNYPSRVKSNSYRASDKTRLLNRRRSGQKKATPPPHKVSNCLNVKPPLKLVQVQPPWIKSSSFHKNNISQNQKLLMAILKTQEYESQDHSKTLFEKSFDRLVNGYSKIKTQPIVGSLIHGKLSSHSPQIFQDSLQRRRHSCPVKPSRLIQIENSIRWAKKHRKNIEPFYKQLGKSFQFLNQEGNGKRNKILQLQNQSQQNQFNRRKNRKRFLTKIQKRLKEHTKNLS